MGEADCLVQLETPTLQESRLSVSASLADPETSLSSHLSQRAVITMTGTDRVSPWGNFFSTFLSVVFWLGGDD